MTEVYTGFTGIDMMAWIGNVRVGRIQAIRFSTTCEMVPIDRWCEPRKGFGVAGTLMFHDGIDFTHLSDQARFDIWFRALHEDGRYAERIMCGVELVLDNCLLSTWSLIPFVAQSVSAWTPSVESFTPKLKGFSLYGDSLL